MTGLIFATQAAAAHLPNQAIFERFLISDSGEIVGKLRPPFHLLLKASGTTTDG